MRLLGRRRRGQRLGVTAADAASAVAEVIGSGVRSAGEVVSPALVAAGHQVPEIAERLVTTVQPVTEAAERRAHEAVGVAKERTADLAEKVVQAAYEASRSLPPESRRRVERTLAKTGIKPPKPPRRGISKRWLAAGLLASAGVAFLFSGTVQDKVYDLVDRLRGEDLDAPLGGYAPGSLTDDGSRPAGAGAPGPEAS